MQPTPVFIKGAPGLAAVVTKMNWSRFFAEQWLAQWPRSLAHSSVLSVQQHADEVDRDSKLPRRTVSVLYDIQGTRAHGITLKPFLFNMTTRFTILFVFTFCPHRFGSKHVLSMLWTKEMQKDKTRINFMVELPNLIDSIFILSVVSDNVAQLRHDTEGLLL